MSFELWAGPLSAELQGHGILQLKIRTELQCLQSAVAGDCILWVLYFIMPAVQGSQ